MEYLTDPVLYLPRLRCPACGAPVRQIRQSGPPSNEIWLALTEPICWVVLGVAALFGVMWQAVFAMAFALLAGVPFLVLILYVRGVKNGTFLCTTCGREASFAEVARRRGR